MSDAVRAGIRRFSPFAFAIAFGFSVGAGFELRIADRSAAAERMAAQISAASEELRHPAPLDAISRALETRIARLGLTLDPSDQSLALLTELERIAGAHRIRLMSVRENPGTPAVRADALERRDFDVVLEGTYPETLRALRDVARAPLVCAASRLVFERSRDAAPGEVRTTLAIQVFRIAARRNDRDVSTHAP